jgi:hypothetical protein
VGQVGLRAWEGGGELGRGVDAAEEDVCQSLSAADAGVPGFEDACVVIDPGMVTGPPDSMTTMVCGLAAATAEMSAS